MVKILINKFSLATTVSYFICGIVNESEYAIKPKDASFFQQRIDAVIRTIPRDI
jgi:hypothetical protein